MAFRSGGVRGKGIVYSRRRGSGRSNRTGLRHTPSVIYEESEEESETPIVKMAKSSNSVKPGNSMQSGQELCSYN